MNTSAKLKFRNDNCSFYKELTTKINELITPKVHQNAIILLRFKLFFYLTVFLVSYSCLFFFPERSLLLLIVNFIFTGLSGILLAFNASHDAVHKTFSKNNKLNALIYYFTFNLQGVNSRLWEIRHKASHHIFPNVDGCDADIDDNPLIRLSTTHKKFWWHKYQHIYSPLLYALYTLHWIIIKDIIYLRKKQIANLRDQKHSTGLKIELILWKLFYFTYMIVLPSVFTDHSLKVILISFFIMHAVISLFFVFTLIISHLCMETEFPVADNNGVLPYNYYRHQLAVSLDYHASNPIANWIFGGFNSHSAHHLFPKLPHTLYTKITPLIKQMALKHNYPYNELSIPKAIRSHLIYLRTLGNITT